MRGADFLDKIAPVGTLRRGYNRRGSGMRAARLSGLLGSGLANQIRFHEKAHRVVDLAPPVGRLDLQSFQHVGRMSSNPHAVRRLP